MNRSKHFKFTMFSIDIKPSVPVMIQFCENYFIFFSPQICSDGLMVMERMNDKKKEIQHRVPLCSTSTSSS